MNDIVQNEEVDEEKNLYDEQRTYLNLLPIINYRKHLPKLKLTQRSEGEGD